MNEHPYFYGVLIILGMMSVCDIVRFICAAVTKNPQLFEDKKEVDEDGGH
jgi:hypothetical protein